MRFIPLAASLTLLLTGCVAESDLEDLPAACDLGPAPAEPDPEVAADPVEFDVEGDTAAMVGTIGADFGQRICDLARDEPQVQTISLIDVPGSSTEENQTLDGGRAARALGFATVVPGDGQVESGGVDFFTSGTERTIADGGCLGVHATEIDDGNGPVSAADLPRDHPEHQAYLDYFAEMGIPTDFYWFTLEAAPPAGIHYLTPEEIVEFDLVTTVPPTVPCQLPDLD